MLHPLLLKSLSYAQPLTESLQEFCKEGFSFYVILHRGEVISGLTITYVTF